jgi:CDP-paratose 2-epimerase
MRILITGICGFAGSALARCLKDSVAGVRICGIDNLMRPGSETNAGPLKHLGADFYHGDIRSAADIAALPDADWVIDAAANPSVLAGTANDSRLLFEHNLASIGNVLEYCRQHRAGLLLLSSSRVYSIAELCRIPLAVENGQFTLDAQAELARGLSRDGIGVDFSTAPPVSLYGATKLACETMALEYGDAFGFPVWITRCGVLAGAGQFGTAQQGIFSYWIHSHLRRRPLRYTGFEGTGYQTRDALHPSDLCRLLLSQTGRTRSGGPRIYTAGGGPPNAISLKQLTAWCDQRFGPHSVASEPTARRYDVPWIAMDNSAAARDFGWAPRITIHELLEEIAAHAEAHPNWLEISGS